MHSRDREVPRVIQIVPLGPVARDDLLTVAALTRRRFGLETAIMPVIRPPERALHPWRGQYDADTILEALFDRLPLDVCRIIGVTEHDLYAEGRNFVFGYAHMRDRVAVLSTLRLRSDDPAVHRSRIEKTVVHEVGHTYQAQHCPRTRCVMRQIQHLHELDLLSGEFCPPCHSRVAVGVARGVHHADGLAELGGSYMRRRRTGRAVAAFAAACAADPRNPHYANHLGVALLAAGEQMAAARAFERAIALAPDMDDEQRMLLRHIQRDPDRCMQALALPGPLESSAPV